MNLIRNVAFEVEELCPHCSHENVFSWSLGGGYKAHCNHCGQIMLICSQCDGGSNGICDWADKGCKHYTYTNSDRIRSLSDKELAKILVAEHVSEVVPYCQGGKKCDEVLDKGEDIPEEMCIECAVDYLNREVVE